MLYNLSYFGGGHHWSKSHEIWWTCCTSERNRNPIFVIKFSGDSDLLGPNPHLTWCVWSVVPSTYSANSLHRPRHQPGSSHTHCSASCHPNDHGQASEILRPHRPFGFRWGPHAGAQRWHRRPAEGLETNLWSSFANVAAYYRKRPETTEPGSVVCPAQSIWS